MGHTARNIALWTVVAFCGLVIGQNGFEIYTKARDDELYYWQIGVIILSSLIVLTVLLENKLGLMICFASGVVYVIYYWTVFAMEIKDRPISELLDHRLSILHGLLFSILLTAISVNLYYAN